MVSFTELHPDSLLAKVGRVFSGDNFYPNNIRFYVSHNFNPFYHKHTADVEIRWDPPVLSAVPYNYTIYYAFRRVLPEDDRRVLLHSDEDEEPWVWENRTVPYENNSLIIRDREVSENFLFQLQANAFKFRGNKTQTFAGSCKTQNPVAKNLLASPSVIYEYDRNFRKFKVLYDSQQSEIIGSQIGSLTFVGYQNILYWVDRKQQPATMVHYSLDTGRETKIFYVDETSEYLQVSNIYFF